jgi:hypothetical protein
MEESDDEKTLKIEKHDLLPCKLMSHICNRKHDIELVYVTGPQQLEGE